MKPDLNQTVREIAIEHPATVRVFESLGIDYCCGGKRTLNDACERAGVPVQRALDLLATVQEAASVDVANWAGASAGELIGHIVGRHHKYVRSESPRLGIMLEKFVGRHGQEHPELASICDLFGALTQELSAHMLKEENILFPYFEQMESAVSRGAAPPPAVFGSVETPISRMLADHDDAGELLAEMRELSSGYRGLIPRAPPIGPFITIRGIRTRPASPRAPGKQHSLPTCSSYGTAGLRGRK